MVVNKHLKELTKEELERLADGLIAMVVCDPDRMAPVWVWLEDHMEDARCPENIQFALQWLEDNAPTEEECN